MNYVKLKDVCTINMGQSPSSGSYNENGHGVPFFQGNADFGERYPVTRKWCSAPTKMAAPEDILISVRAPIGAMNYAKEECCIGRGLAALTPNREKVAPEYIFWLLKGKNEELNCKGTGSTFKAIGRNILEETLVPNISLEKQAECAIILEKTYRVILSRKQQLQKLDELVKARFVELFGSCKRMASMNELCSIITDGTHQPPKFQSNGIPFIFVSNLVKNTVTYNAEKFISEETYGELYKRTPIEVGDLLLSTVGSYGHPAVVAEDRKFLFQRHIAYLKPKHDIVNSFYLHAALLSPGGQGQIEEKVKGVAQKTLNLSEIKKILVPLPSIEEQNAFETFVKQTDKLKNAIQKALSETQLLLDSLMQKSFE